MAHQRVTLAPRSRPAHLPAVVPRGDLLEESLGDRPSALVQAPAGWGKTTLLRQWGASRPDEVVHLSVQEDDQDPVVLIGRLLGALDGLGAPTSHLLAGPVSDPEFLATVTLPRLVEYWISRTRPVTLVVDDAHRLDGSMAWQVVGALLENAEIDRRVIVSGRTQSPLRAAHLVAEQRLIRIGFRELAMDPDQAVELLSARGATVGEVDAAILVRRTSGWPAALSLAGVGLAHTQDAKRVTETFSGADPEMSLYFRAEVLSGLPSGFLRFLERTSILPSLDADSCDSVLEADKNSVTLTEFARHLLLRPSLARPGKFIHHPMLREHLQAELHIREPQAERSSHRRAALFLGRSGATESAVAHARSSGDADLAGALIWRSTGALLSRGRRLAIERWLASFEDREILAQPALALTMAWCSLEAGRHIQPWSSAAASGLAALGSSADPSLRCGMSLLDAATAADGPAGMLARAQEAYQAAAPDDPWRALACYLVGSAHHLQGQNREAGDWLEEGEHLGRMLSAPSAHALCLARQSLLALDNGDWGTMSSLSTRALDVVRHRGLAETATMVPVLAVSAMAFAHERRGDEARSTARRAARLLSYLETRLPWLTYEAKVVLGRTYLLLGDPAAARNMLAEAQTVAARSFESRHLKCLLNDAWSMAATSPLTTTLGPTAVTTAEWRVLQLLPTHLSFQEMGNTLFVSRNTVKTQAISVYRKLGVSSRSEAVEAARQLGLLVSGPQGSNDL